jgi:hypothetical protein
VHCCQAGLKTSANAGCRRFYLSNYVRGKKSNCELGFRAPLRLSAPLCDIEMFFVMALSSCSHYTELSETKLSQAAADALSPFDLSPAIFPGKLRVLTSPHPN